MIWVNGKLIGFLPVRRLSTGSPEKDLGQGKFKLANSLIWDSVDQPWLIMRL